jgi:hypothetical protein
MITKSRLTSDQLAELQGKSYPIVRDTLGQSFPVDDHGLCYIGRNVQVVTPPSGRQVQFAETWITNHQQQVRKARTAFRLKTAIEFESGTYLTNGAVITALSAMGNKLEATTAGDCRIVHR